MNFDPTLLEAIVAAVLTLIGAGAGVGVTRRRGGDDGRTPEVERQTELVAKVAELSASVERLETVELGRIDERVSQQGRAHQRLAADFDAVADALDVIVTHIGDELPEQARRSVGVKLQQRQRHEVTGRRRAAKD